MSTSGPAIKASRIGKRYRLGDLHRAAHIKTLRDWLASLVSRTASNGSRLNNGTLWALREVSFEVQPGEVVGIIGHNGAGKSTLLKILSRITEPTEGEVEILGRVGSLLEIGTGFHPDLTGRENIFLNGAILGMRRTEITEKFDEIVSFAGTEAFLETPVRHYSSGMYMRLAFAVAAHLDPEILIIDEVLAVGDAAFQKRCLSKMRDVSKLGRTVLFVSHNLGAIRSLCTRALVFREGMVQFDGPAEAAIAYYLSSSAARGEQDGQVSFEPAGLPFSDLNLRSVRLVDRTGDVRALFDATEAIGIEVEYELTARLRGLRTLLVISTQEGDLAFQSTDEPSPDTEQAPGRYKVSCSIPGALLNCRMYAVEIGFDVPGLRTLAPRRQYLLFVVAGANNHGSAFAELWPGVVCPSLRWETRPM